MNTKTLITTLLLKGCLLGNSVMAADDGKLHHQLVASLAKNNLPGVHRSLLHHAQAGDENAQLALAKIHESGADQDTAKMLEWYRKSANNGNAEAQFQLGLLYIDGEVPNGDWDTGYFWLELAAEQGHQQARVVYESLQNEYFSIGC